MSGEITLPPVAVERRGFSLLVPQLSVPKEAIIGVFGHSGSGKSTYLRALLSLFGPGRAALLDQGDQLLKHLSARQNLELGALVGDLDDAERPAIVEGLSERLHLSRFRNQFVETLSGGQRRRVYLAQMLATNKPILLLDEPFTGLGTRYEALAGELLVEQARGKELTLLVSHDLSLLTIFCTIIVLIDEGRYVGCMDPTEAYPEQVRERWASVVGVPNIVEKDQLLKAFDVIEAEGLASELLPKRFGIWPSWVTGARRSRRTNGDPAEGWILQTRREIILNVSTCYLRGEWMARCEYQVGGRLAVELWIEARAKEEGFDRLHLRRVVAIT